MKDIKISSARIVATILVVLGHCTYPYWGGWNFNAVEFPIASKITSYIYCFHMALFIMLSGYVFSLAYAQKVNEIHLNQFVKKRIARLIIPMLFIKFAIWNPVNIVLGNYELFSVNSLVELGHVWYLAVLFILSVCLFVLLKYLSPRLNGKTLDIILLLSALLISVASPVLPNGGKDSIEGLYYFTLFFVMGYLLQKYKYDSFVSRYFWVFLIVGGLLFFTCDFNEYHNIGTKIILSILNSVGWIGLSFRISDIVMNSPGRKIEIYSMPIYLFHLPVIWLIVGLTNVCMAVHPVIVIIGLFVISIAISIVIGKIMRISKIGRALIGG